MGAHGFAWVEVYFFLDAVSCGVIAQGARGAIRGHWETSAAELLHKGRIRVEAAWPQARRRDVAAPAPSAGGARPTRDPAARAFFYIVTVV